MVNIMPNMNDLTLDPMGPLALRATSISLIEGR